MAPICILSPCVSTTRAVVYRAMALGGPRAVATACFSALLHLEDCAGGATCIVHGTRGTSKTLTTSSRIALNFPYDW